MPHEQPAFVTPSLTPEQVKAATEISEDFYTVFSNHVRVSATATEFRLFFGENFQTATNEVKIIEKFSVVLTPVQAKALLRVLGEIVQKIEAATGTIPTIESLQRKQTQQPAAPASEPQE
jgi:Protein of unknown function (DUF3467)